VSLGERDHRRAPALHHRPPVGLLVVAGADHVDHALEPDQGAGEREGRAPLPGAGLGRQPLDAGLLVGVRLGDRAVGLVRSGRRDALVLVVDARRRIEGALEPVRPVQRRRAPQLVDLADRLRDLDLGIGRNLLADQRHREDRRQVIGPRRLHRSRVERRQRVTRQVRHQVHPVGGDAVLGQRELGRLGHAAILNCRTHARARACRPRRSRGAGRHRGAAGAAARRRRRRPDAQAQAAARHRPARGARDQRVGSDHLRQASRERRGPRRRAPAGAARVRRLRWRRGPGTGRGVALR
jgi:hypothetical protein